MKTIQGLNRYQIRDQNVVGALSRVPRHEFVGEDVRDLAYADRALPIAAGQTISQPFIVALMTQEARIRPGSRVLEIGTGSGYQAAVLAELGAEVFTVEIIPELAASARATLDRLGYTSVRSKLGDGWSGWEELAPFDAVLVTAGTPRVPPELVRQTRDGGRIVLPLEGTDGHARLVVIEKSPNGLEEIDLGGVSFVPLTGTVRESEPEDPEGSLQ